MKQRILAEWEAQSFVQLTWPHEGTDWADYLEEAQACFLQIAAEVLKREDLLIVAPNTQVVEQQLKLAGVRDGAHRLVLYECPTNDTWARDHAFLTTVDEAGTVYLNDFCFNGWGQKFASHKDNLINESLYLDEILETADGGRPVYVDNRKIVLEGGSVESDGMGTLLTTETCLFAENRNWYQERKEAEDMLREKLGAKRVLWLANGNLTGDDTDGHVDTLARLCPNDTILYVHCTDEDDIDFAELDAMETELKELRTADGKPYHLVPLPMPDAVYEEDGSRLPATYANFLIINGAVLVPTYNEPEKDAAAITAIHSAFPDREVVGIDCRTLIRQHGSLHCVTMQYPACVRLAE